MVNYPDWGSWMAAHNWPNMPGDKPQVVTLCGSTRFVDEFNQWRQSLTLKGHIVLSIEIVTYQRDHEDPQKFDPDLKEMLDLLHFEKIKMSDWILVLNRGGYLGESTLREIEYAKEHGVPIQYLEPLPSEEALSYLR